MNTLDRNTRLILEGSIFRSLLEISWPVVLANLLHISYQLVDFFWVGRLGSAALAAVSVSFPILFLMLGTGFGLSIAGSVFIAHYAGARRPQEVNHASAQTLILMLALALASSVIGYIASPLVLEWMKLEPDVYAGAMVYLRTSFIGMIFTFGFMVYQSILRGVGEVRFPLWVICGTVVGNAILDPVLIFGWGPIPALGILGAALATIITQAVAAVTGLRVLFTGRYGVHIRLRDLVPDFDFIRETVMVGLPASIEQATRPLGALALLYLTAGFGTLSVAAFGIGTRILGFVFIPALGLAMATTTLVGQNIGAGNIRRAEDAARLSAWAAFWGLNAVAVLTWAGAVPLVRLFAPGDPELLTLTAEFVRILSLSYWMIGVQQTLLGAFRGAGGTVPAMAIGLMTQWVLQVPMTWFLCTHTILGVKGVWWGFPLANLIATLVTMTWFRYGAWQDMKLMERGLAPRMARKPDLMDEAAGEQEYIS